jgi:hypothetical protein
MHKSRCTIARLSILGFVHSLQVGAKIYVDAVNREEDFQGFESGTFVASLCGMSGHRSDQADFAKQEAAYQAMRVYV